MFNYLFIHQLDSQFQSTFSVNGVLSKINKESPLVSGDDDRWHIFNIYWDVLEPLKRFAIYVAEYNEISG